MPKKKFNILLKECRSRETGNAAMRELLTFYFPKIVKHITAKYRNKAIGEDIAQEFFIKLLKTEIDKEIKHPTAWVFKICDNLAKDFFEKDDRYKAAYSHQELDLTDEPFQKVVYLEYLEQIDKLDAGTRNIILLYMYDGCSLKEIAQKLNINYNTVRQKFSRGIKKLKKL